MSVHVDGDMYGHIMEDCHWQWSSFMCLIKSSLSYNSGDRVMIKITLLTFNKIGICHLSIL